MNFCGVTECRFLDGCKEKKKKQHKQFIEAVSFYAFTSSLGSSCLRSPSELSSQFTPTDTKSVPLPVMITEQAKCTPDKMWRNQHKT